MNDHDDDEEIGTTGNPDTPDKLTSWKKEPRLTDLKQDYDDAKRVTDTFINEIAEWKDHMHARGSAKPKVPKGSSAVQPKLIRKQAEWRYSSLSEPFLSSPDIFEINPVSFEDAGAARQNQVLLNNQFNTVIDKQKFVDEMVRAGVDEGTIIMKTGWMYRTRSVTEMKPEYALYEDNSQQQAQIMEQVVALQQESPSQYADLPEEIRVAFEEGQQDGKIYRAEVTSSKEVKVDKVIANHPTVEVKDYRNIIIDPSCGGDMSKAKFVVELFESSYADLKADGRYKNLDTVKKNTVDIMSQPDYTPASTNEGNFDFADKLRKRVVVYEYWGFLDIDGTGELKPIVASWIGDTLIRMEENPFPDGKLPYIVVQYLPRKRCVYGESDGSLLIDNQKIIGAVTRGMIDILGKSANAQQGVQKGALDITQRRRFDRGETYEFNPGTDPRTAIHMHTYAEIPQSAQYVLNQQQADAESMTGVKAFNGGISGAALGDTATGVRGALDAASKRELGILRRIAAGVVEVGRRMIAMNAEFLNDTEVVRVTNEQFIEVRRDDLPGNFDLKLTISTAEEDKAKLDDLTFMLQTMGPNLDWGMNAKILSKICDLKKMPDLAKEIRDYQPQPDPLAQQKAQLELMLLQAQIQESQAKAQHYATGAGLQQAKVGTEQAKSRALGSQADLADLEFVKEESGTRQAEELQRQDKQIEGNARIAMVNSLMKREEEAMYPRTTKR